ncbi:MAG TPA: TetR/AcrR family transcriptional regulator [Mycobacteriales bacterium]
MRDRSDGRVGTQHVDVAGIDAQGRVSPRRAPVPEERQRDAERTRQHLLAAALDEFAAKGYAGARVHDIAAAAGVNKQLISYYFGGKDGLYRELQRIWEQREAAFADPEVPLPELAVRYLRDALADPRMMRLLLWRSLAAESGPPRGPGGEESAGMRRRQARGELAADLDPGAVVLMLMGAVAAPVAMRQMVWRVTGLDPETPEFEEYFAEQLGRMVRRLTGPDPGSNDAGPPG